MSSRPRGRLSCLILIGLFCVVTARADRLTDRNATHYGKLARITGSELLFDENCTGDQRVTVLLTNFVALDVDDNCQPPEHNFISSPITLPCPGEEKTLFTIAFKESGITTAGAIETVEAGQLKIIPIQTKGYLVGLIQDVRSILYGRVCLERLTQPQWPSSFQRSFSTKAKPKRKQ